MADRTDVPRPSPAESPQDHSSVIILAVSHDDGPRVLIDTGLGERFLAPEQAVALASELAAAAELARLLL